MNILFVNMLEERHATTRRSRLTVRLLRELAHGVTYLESNIRDDLRGAISTRQVNSIGGYVLSTITRSMLCLRLKYDIAYFQKMLPFHIPCMIAARMRGKKVIVDIDDIDTEYQPNELRKVLHSIGDRIVLRLVDLITVHNEYLARELLTMHRDSRIARVNQCVDLGTFFRRPPNQEIVSRYNLKGKTVFAFLGSFSTGSCKELPLLLQAFADASKRRRDIALFLIMGDGPWKQAMLELIEHLGISALTTVVGFVPLDEVPEYLSVADCGLVFMDPNRGNMTRFSLKVLEYLASGITVLGRLYGATAQQLGKYCDLVADEAGLAAKMVSFDPRAPKTGRAHRYLARNHDNPVLKGQLKKILEMVVS